jgi:hypothetical protein
VDTSASPAAAAPPLANNNSGASNNRVAIRSAGTNDISVPKTNSTVTSTFTDESSSSNTPSQQQSDVGTDAVEQLRQQMAAAGNTGNYVLAGSIQVKIKRLEQLVGGMKEAARAGDFIRAGRLQEEFNALTAGPVPPTDSNLGSGDSGASEAPIGTVAPLLSGGANGKNNSTSQPSSLAVLGRFSYPPETSGGGEMKQRHQFSYPPPPLQLPPPPPAPPARPAEKLAHQPPVAAAEGVANKKLHVSNFPQNKSHLISEVLGAFGSISRVQMLQQHPHFPGKGQALVTFESLDDAEKVRVQVDGETFWGLPIKIRYSKNRE